MAKMILTPILPTVVFAVVSAAVYLTVLSVDWFSILSLNYLIFALALPGVIFPLALIVQAVRLRHWSWWAVGLACLLSAGTTIVHFFFIAALGIGV